MTLTPAKIVVWFHVVSILSGIVFLWLILCTSLAYLFFRKQRHRVRFRPSWRWRRTSKQTSSISPKKRSVVACGSFLFCFAWCGEWIYFHKRRRWKSQLHKPLLILSHFTFCDFFVFFAGGEAGPCRAGSGEVPKEARGDVGAEEAEQGPVWQDGPVLGPNPQPWERQQGIIFLWNCIVGYFLFLREASVWASSKLFITPSCAFVDDSPHFASSQISFLCTLFDIAVYRFITGHGDAEQDGGAVQKQSCGAGDWKVRGTLLRADAGPAGENKYCCTM